MDTLRTPAAVLFDLDDTLFDHRFAARAALSCVHQMHACFAAQRFELFEDAHAHCLEELHRLVLSGALGIDDARIERFRRLFAAAGVNPDDESLQATSLAYREQYMAGRRPIEGARDLLAAISRHARVGIVTNNLLEEQQAKIRLCGFEPFVDALVVSEEAGISKPDPGIFAIALERLGVPAADAVMVGDSWTADIEGARAAGIRAIWFNRTGIAKQLGGVQEITALMPIEDIVHVILGKPGPNGVPAMSECAS